MELLPHVHEHIFVRLALIKGQKHRKREPLSIGLHQHQDTERASAPQYQGEKVLGKHNTQNLIQELSGIGTNKANQFSFLCPRTTPRDHNLQWWYPHFWLLMFKGHAWVLMRKSKHMQQQAAAIPQFLKLPAKTVRKATEQCLTRAYTKTPQDKDAYDIETTA